MMRSLGDRLMGFDQISLFLYPRRWVRCCVADPLASVSAARSNDCKSPPLQLEAVCQWFETRQFQATHHTENFARFYSANIESVCGPEPEIVACIGTDEDEVSSLYCRFRLTQQTPRLDHWDRFMRELCESFQLQISVSETAYVGPDQFRRLLLEDDRWHGFAEQFGWR
jgi:hypothetical protein